MYVLPCNTLVEMELVYKLCWIFLLVPCLGVAQDGVQRLMFIAGPLTDELVSDLNFESTPLRESALISGGSQSEFLCYLPSLSSLKPYFTDLHASGVTHFKVFLPWTQILPEGNAEKPNKTNVICYRKLLSTLIAADLKPILILHNKRLPKSLSAQLALKEELTTAFTDLFAEYADFCFWSFGVFVDTWLTFSDLSETAEGLSHGDPLALPFQALAAAHEKVYKIYHEKYSSEGKGT